MKVILQTIRPVSSNILASNLAMKALGRATAYVFGTFTAAIGAACYTWDIYSLRDLRRTARRYKNLSKIKLTLFQLFFGPSVQRRFKTNDVGGYFP